MGEDEGKQASRIPADESLTTPLAEAFVAANWPQLAASAWRQYEKLGRGAIVVPWAAVMGHAAGSPIGFGVPYIAGGEPVERAVVAYDPKRQIVVLFLEDDDYKAANKGGRFGPGAKLVRGFTGDPPPPEAHARRGN
jgi:hypothetical protein